MNTYNESPLVRIQNKYSSFHPKEKRIADYILKEADQIIYQSVKETLPSSAERPNQALSASARSSVIPDTVN